MLGRSDFDGEREYGEVLVGEAEGFTRFWENRPWFGLGLDDAPLKYHPEYQAVVVGICSGCRAARADFTPFADPAIVRQLLDFNLDCITRWRQCETAAQIMPTAARMYEQERAAAPIDEARGQTCELPLEVLGRDYKYAAIAEVVSIRTKQEPDGSYMWMRYRTTLSLKNHAVSPGLATVGDWFLGKPGDSIFGGGRVANVKRGTKFIVLSEATSEDRDALPGSGECGVVAYSEQNLAAILRGIQRDALSDAP